MEWNNKTFRFWEISQNDNEFQGLSQRKHRVTEL